MSWQAILQSPAEKQAFMSLLDEYFSSRSGTGTGRDNSTAAAPLASTSAPGPPPITARTRPSGLTSTPPPQPAPSAPSTASVSLANAALKQPAITSSVLKQAGMSAGAANVAARFGAQHSEKLAPHVAAGVQSRLQSNGGGELPPKGPRTPSGIQSTAAKSFGKALLTAKAPMSKEDARQKKNFHEALAVHNSTAPRAASPAAPPPMRGAAWKAHQGIGQATALYDFDGTEESDLPVTEGETVTVVERVSDDWWKCRNASGGEGHVPSSYLQAL
ncbi:cytoskeletal protein binding protein [Microbotryomycetes sp. JL201]|nr:cytoskeletal protein binding protein [Microbotryomycetes sp. JL201]